MHCGDLQEEVVQLESQGKEQKDSKRGSEAVTDPVISWSRFTELGNQDRSPDPPASLESCDDSKGRSGSDSEGYFGAIEPGLS
jgi:hypothetical protein